MKWKHRLALLALSAIPAFTGYPLRQMDMTVIEGISWGWIGYFLWIHILIRFLLGAVHYANTLSVAALITVPVVFVGGALSYLIHLAGMGPADGTAAYSGHYVALCLTMLTVIPLALSMVAVIPFHRIEHNLLLNRKGVAWHEKILLMFLRVFNHILFFVIPNILEVMREEKRWQIDREGGASAESRGKPGNQGVSLSKRLRRLIRAMTSMGIESICTAVQYIPLWAVEISRLPDREIRRKDT